MRNSSQILEWCPVRFKLDPLVTDGMNAPGSEIITTEVAPEPPFQSWLHRALREQELGRVLQRGEFP